MDEYGMLAWIQHDLEGLHNPLQRNDDRCILVCWNRHLEVPDPILSHKLDIFQRIIPWDEGAGARQPNK